MKFTKARIIWGPSATTDRIVFDLDDINPATPYVVRQITGLEPPANVLSISDKLFEGGIFQGQRPENREIVMLVSLQPNYNIGEDPGTLRKRLYQMMSPKRGTDVIFQLLNAAETEMVETRGRIKRIEANPFSQDPEVQITMSCFSAYFNEPEFVFPTPSTLGGKTQIDVTNDGDVSVGFFITFVLNATPTTLASFTLTDLAGKFIRVTYPFVANDKIIIETFDGAKKITRKRNGADQNLLPYMDGNSTWLKLDPGINGLRPSVTTYTIESLKFTRKHWGF